MNILLPSLMLLAAQTPAVAGDLPAAPMGREPLIEAVIRSPAIAAARQRVAAARERAGSAGRFPNPQIEGMASGVRTPSARNPMVEINLRQPLPKAGERAADRERASAAIAMAEAEYAAKVGETAAEVAMGLAEASAATARARLLERQIERAGKIFAAIDSKLASAGGRMADRLSLQTGIAAMRLMAEREQRMAEDARAEIRARLGLAAVVPLPPFAAPAENDIRVGAAPASLLAAAKGSEARAMARMARASARPMIAVGLRFEREQDEMGDIDTFGVAFMTELPFWSPGYARAEEKAAYAEEAASRSEADAVHFQWRSARARSERAASLAATAKRLADETRARLDAEYEALVRTAGTGGMEGEIPVLMILDILERQLAADMQVIDAESAAGSARAELWRFAPTGSFLFLPKTKPTP